jgi:isopentenyl diphosphate isomerase/L-lactate dehydrogenase-like FMN-dependent dehydrogenase
MSSCQTSIFVDGTKTGSGISPPVHYCDTNERDTTTDLFGHKISAIILFSTTELSKIYHPGGAFAATKEADNGVSIEVIGEFYVCVIV